MARIDPEISRLEKRLSQARPAEPIKDLGPRRRCRLKGRCCLFFLLLIVFMALTTAAAAAKTGIFRVPGFTEIFYRVPQPSRTVELPAAPAFKAEGLTLGLAADKKTISLKISEKELTFLLRQALTTGQNAMFAPNLQAVIADGQVELYGLMLKPLKANLTVKVRPSLTGGRLEYKIIEFKVGNLGLPAALAQNLINRLWGAKIGNFWAAVDKKFSLKNLELGTGEARLEIVAKTEAAAQEFINLSADILKP